MYADATETGHTMVRACAFTRVLVGAISSFENLGGNRYAQWPANTVYGHFVPRPFCSREK